MVEIPSLYSLCIGAIKRDILLSEDDLPPDIYELPNDLFDSLVISLPPVALQKLQECIFRTAQLETYYRRYIESAYWPLSSWEENVSSSDCSRSKRKHTSYLNFNAAWRKLCMSRWPHFVGQDQAVNWLAKKGVKECNLKNDWQQKYWEIHLQSCLNEVAEVALLPGFCGSIGGIDISDAILGSIGYVGYKRCSRCDYAKLSYHFRKFACYARDLQLQNVLCVAESYNLLKTCKLHRLEVHRIYSEEHAETLCELLKQNRETLKSLELIRCKLSSTFMNAICVSLCIEGQKTHLIEHFSIKASSFVGMNRFDLPIGLESFLLSGKSLTSLVLCENHLGQKFANMLFKMLLGETSVVSVLDLSENNIAGSFSHIDWRSFCCSQSLRVLNLRGNYLRKNETVSLKSALVHMPNLENLDLSDNPIENDGIKSLLPVFTEMSKMCSNFKSLRVENCELSCAGAKQLLDVLSTMEHSLDSLSLGGNNLGSKAGATLGKFLNTGVKALDIEDIGLGSSGFLELQNELGDDLKLVCINMSKNRGGAEAAKLLATLIRRGSELVAANAGYNLIPFESFPAVCSAMEVAKGKLELIDLTGNTWGDQFAVASVMSKYKINGEIIVVLPSSTAPYAPHDDDP